MNTFNKNLYINKYKKLLKYYKNNIKIKYILYRKNILILKKLRYLNII
ncbi:hypothetical protein PGAL8A_API04500 (apicoplast) [Plasmodium gallinaceum]|uniref:Open reading frame 51 n=1 Tax=Plasmodium gallinaceum TaxID=5849 RepID=H7CDZ4_PLAGA|nr:hypothetical protein PGAL8A_API04500 [Plasmodium gallinaceum]BAL70764.1 open reading frame 51 [Plasmodium gallinaceum]CRG98255.1 hypothetical protein PGAL8A_API04500 [Plasmodium gallinaceum]